MIVSHKYKFIFIHVPKTGGTSIREALQNACNESFDCRLINIDDIKKFGLEEFCLNTWSHHLPAGEIRKIVGESIWESYFKFGFVRNPFEILVSEYFYTKNYILKGNEPMDFIERVRLAKSCYDFNDYFLNRYGRHPSLSLLGRLMDKDYIAAVDFIGRYERLQADFKYICQKIGIKDNLPLINNSFHDHYSKYYSSSTKEKVMKMCRDDLDKFAYSFDYEEL